MFSVLWIVSQKLIPHRDGAGTSEWVTGAPRPGQYLPMVLPAPPWKQLTESQSTWATIPPPLSTALLLSQELGSKKGLAFFFHSVLKEELKLTCTRKDRNYRVTCQIMGSMNTSSGQKLGDHLFSRQGLTKDQTGEVTCLGAHNRPMNKLRHSPASLCSHWSPFLRTLTIAERSFCWIRKHIRVLD